ncbi:F-box protein [Candidatus Paracaedibacter acanthamoebae]
MEIEEEHSILSTQLNLLNLPDEVSLRVFSFLPSPSLANMSTTCKKYFTLTEDKRFLTPHVNEQLESNKNESPF